MENTKINDCKINSLDINLLKNYKDTLITMTVSYKDHTCVGEMDDGEITRDTESEPKIFNYPLLGILKTEGKTYSPNGSFFILSSYNKNNVLVPFRYKVTPYWAPGWCCTDLTNSIEDITLNDGSKIIPGLEFMSSFHGGVGHVSVYCDHITPERAAELEGLTLTNYGCKYEEDKHIITGDIGKLVDTLIPLWK